MKFFKFDISSIADSFRANSKVILLTALAVVIVIGAAFAIAFFSVLQGAEKVMVPEVEGKGLAEALIEMQAKELYPRIQLRYSDRQEEQGRILEQDPKAGAIVKAGKRVSLVVSRGVIVDHVGNFIGRNIDDVRVELQTLFTSGGTPLLSVSEPVLYRASSEPVGTILEQDPAPETAIVNPVQISFVVSRGTASAEVTVPDMQGMSIAELVQLMGQSGLIFNFTARLQREGETAGTVVEQSPQGGASAREFNVVDVAIALPRKAPSGLVYGIFREELPEYPYPFQVTIDVISPAGERREYLSMTHPGGLISVPYLLPEGSTISLNVLNREVGRYETSPAIVQDE